MVALEFLLNIIPIVSLVVVLTYYSLQIRHQNRMREMQVFMQIINQIRTHEFIKLTSIVWNMKYEGWSDWLEKYGADAGPSEEYIAWATVYQNYNAIGSIVKRGLIDPEFVAEQLTPSLVLLAWEKLNKILPEMRESLDSPKMWESFEYLAGEMQKLQKSQ